MKNKKYHKIIIVGAGPAGVAASIQLHLYNIDHVIIEKNEPGGLVRNAFWIENYPGFPSGITGKKFASLLKKHLKILNTKIIYDEVLEIKRKKSYFKIITKRTEYYSDILVIASGSKPKEFPKIKISEKASEKIFYEIFSISGLHNRKIFICGAGDIAFDYSLNLAKFNDITILNRGKTIKAIPALYRKIVDNRKITYFDNIKITEILQLKEKKILIKAERMNKIITFLADNLIFAIGRESNISFLSSINPECIAKYEKEGILYIIGDAKNGVFRQVSISCGDGILAAMKIYKKLMEK